MPKYFVPGGAGFIGSHLSEKLIAEGNQVTVYDNLVSGSKENIKHLIGKTGFLFIQNDLLNTTALNEAMKGYDIIWHLGANTDIPAGINVTDLDLKNCTTATWNVLEGMRANNIDTILFASSACVYGDAPPAALSETYGPLLPINLYGAGKLACEGLMSSYSHLFGMMETIRLHHPLLLIELHPSPKRKSFLMELHNLGYECLHTIERGRNTSLFHGVMADSRDILGQSITSILQAEDNEYVYLVVLIHQSEIIL
jgi:GDP-D-mannose dehydratase